MGKEPGRDEDYVWGMAYRIDPNKADEVKAYMGESQALYKTEIENIEKR